MVYNYNNGNLKGGSITDNLMVIWIVIAAGCLALDIATSAFLFVWFTVGGMAAIIANLLNYGSTVQIVTFIIVSALFTAVGYPLAKRTIKKTVPITKTMEQGYVGRELVVSDEVVDKALVKLDGIYWTVKNQGRPIAKGDKVKITGIEGNKILINKI